MPTLNANRMLFPIIPFTFIVTLAVGALVWLWRQLAELKEVSRIATERVAKAELLATERVAKAELLRLAAVEDKANCSRRLSVATAQLTRVSELVRALSTEELRIVTTARGNGRSMEVLAKYKNDEVKRSSMQTLNPREWVNDEIVNYYLKVCLARRDETLSELTGRKRSHFFNSHFMAQMFPGGGEYNCNNVKSWSKNVPGKDIFELKYIICPINYNNKHWTTAVIFMEEKQIKYYDSLVETKATNLFSKARLNGLLQYLKDEYKTKNHGKEMDATEWQTVKCDNTPRQSNGEFE